MHINSFLVSSGAEINCIRLGSNKSTNIVKNNGRGQLYNTFNVEDEEMYVKLVYEIQKEITVKEEVK